ATEARRQADRAQAVKNFVTIEMLKAASPFSSGADVKVVDVLDRAALRAESAFAGDPDMLAAVDEALGGSSFTLAVYDTADRHLARALDHLKATLGADAPPTLDVTAMLVGARAGHLPPAEVLGEAREIFERCQRLLGPKDRVTLGAMHNAGAVL